MYSPVETDDKKRQGRSKNLVPLKADIAKRMRNIYMPFKDAWVHKRRILALKLHLLHVFEFVLL